jgi:hypothetical protein
MLKYASDIADHEHRSEDMEKNGLPNTTTPSSFISVNRSNIRLHHGDAMKAKIDCVQAQNRAAHKSDWQKLRWLAKTLALHWRSAVHGCGNLHLTVWIVLNYQLTTLH